MSYMYLGPGIDLVQLGTPPPMTISGLVRMDHTSEGRKDQLVPEDVVPRKGDAKYHVSIAMP